MSKIDITKKLIAYEDHTDEQRNPELKLLRAILCRAILDYSLYHRELKTPVADSKFSYTCRKRNYDEIKEWFESKDNKEFSFLWICEHLFPENPDFIMKKIKIFILKKDYRFKLCSV